MIKKLLIHVIFFAMLLIVYIIFTMIYSRKIAIEDTIGFYFILVTIVFCINLIKTRKIKWLIVSLMCILILVLWVLGIGAIADNPFDLLFIDNSPVNIPFLPRFLHWHINNDNFILRFTVSYLIYFWGAILYWYLVYFLSKRIVNIQHVHKI
jgi:hypothetical protein